MNTNHQHSKEDEEDDLQLQFDSIDNLVPTPYDEDHPQITTSDIPPQEETDQPSSNPHNASSAEQCGRGKQVIEPHQNGKIQEDLKNTGQQPDGPITTSSDSDRGILDLGNNHNGNNGNCTASGARKGGSSSVKRFDTKVENGPPLDVVAKSQLKLIQETKPCSDLEIALSAELERKNIQIEKLTSEVIKLKQFISKRKQTYKRKRKEDGAPTRALSAYNIFVQERFEQLARQNEEALMSSNTDRTLQRVPPASLVAQAGNEWRELPPEQKEIYKERAKADKKRYEEEMQKYSPPETQSNQKRNSNNSNNNNNNKTGYNIFFSEFVDAEKLNNNTKEEDDLDHVASDKERGNLDKIVGNAWKALSLEEREEYERRAEKINESEGCSISREEEEHGDQEEKEQTMHKTDHNITTAMNDNKNTNNKSSSAVIDDPTMIPQAPVVHQPGHRHHDVRSPYHPPPPHPHGHFYPPYPYEYYPPVPMPPHHHPLHPHHHLATTNPDKKDPHRHLTANTSSSRGGGSSRHMAAHHLHPFPYPPPHYMHPHYRQHEHSTPHDKLPRPSSPADI